MSSAANIPPGQQPGQQPTGFLSPSGQPYPAYLYNQPGGHPPPKPRPGAKPRPKAKPKPRRQAPARRAPARPAPASGAPFATPPPAPPSSGGGGPPPAAFVVQQPGEPAQLPPPQAHLLPGGGQPEVAGGQRAGLMPELPAGPVPPPIPPAAPFRLPDNVAGPGGTPLLPPGIGFGPGGAGPGEVGAGVNPPEPGVECPQPLSTCEPCAAPTIQGDGGPAATNPYAPPATYSQYTPPPSSTYTPPEPSVPPPEEPATSDSGASQPTCPTCCAMPQSLIDALTQSQQDGQAQLAQAITLLSQVTQSLDAHLNDTLQGIERVIGGCNGSACGQIDRALIQCQGTLEKCVDRVYNQIAAMLGEAIAHLSTLGYRMEEPPQAQVPSAPVTVPPPLPQPVPPEPLPQAGVNTVKVEGGVTVKLGDISPGQGVYVKVDCAANAQAIAQAVAQAIANAVPALAPRPTPPQVATPAPAQNVQVAQSVQEMECAPIPPLAKNEGPAKPSDYKLPCAARSLFQFVSGPDIIIQSPDTWSVRPGQIISVQDSDGHTVLP